jgi:hypothetical protein
VLRWLDCWRERDNQLLIEPLPLADVDPLEELIRVVNEAQERDARTNVVFMSPSSGNGLYLFKEDGPSNLLRGTSAAGSTDFPVARSASRTFNRRLGPQLAFIAT